MESPYTIVFILGQVMIFASSVLCLVIVVAQIVEAFKEDKKWGIASIVGVCLCLLPNLIWVVLGIKDRWEYLVSYLLTFPLILMGWYLMGFEAGRYLVETM